MIMGRGNHGGRNARAAVPLTASTGEATGILPSKTDNHEGNLGKPAEARYETGRDFQRIENERTGIGRICLRASEKGVYQ
jgi:hypothetical protein